MYLLINDHGYMLKAGPASEVPTYHLFLLC